MLETLLEKIPDEFRPQIVAAHNVIVGLQEENNRLRHALFGAKSESHHVGEIIEPKGTLFNECESVFEFCGPPLPPDFDGPEADQKKRRRSPKSGSRKPLPEDLPRRRVVHEPDAEQLKCPADGAQLEKIAENVSEKLNFVPGYLEVVQDVYPVYSCPQCEKGVVEAPVVPSLLPRTQCAAGLLAQLVVCKFVLGLPLYRLENDFSEMGMEVSRTSMARWIIGGAHFLKPFLELVKSTLEKRKVVHADETVVQVLKEHGKTPQSQSYMWMMCSGGDGPPIVWFEYHRGRDKEAALALLGSFSGLLHADGYDGYNMAVKSSGLTRVGCWAHVRRKFDVARKDGLKGRGLAAHFLSLIQRLFKLERNWSGTDPEKRLEGRQKESQRVVETIRSLMDETQEQVSPKSKLGLALGYLRNEWDTLVVFLKDGRAELSNNRAENYIRPFVIGRKGWLFSDTPDGATASAALYSLVITARANGVQARPWLISLFTELPVVLADDPNADLSPWLPWNWKQTTSEDNLLKEENA
jgi:transposase